LLSLGINASRPVAEILIIVVGVLIALGVDNWNDNRIDRNLEAEYLARLTEDLQYNIQRSTGMTETLDRKVELLKQVGEITVHEFQSDPDSAVYALRFGAQFGWALPEFRTGTVEELQSTGNLGLIRDVRLRAALNYYDVRYRSLIETIEARMTGYPSYVYSLLPDFEDSLVDSSLPSQQLSSQSIDEIAGEIQTVEFRRLLNQERNYAAHAARRIREIQALSEDTLESLTEELSN